MYRDTFVTVSISSLMILIFRTLCALCLLLAIGFVVVQSVRNVSACVFHCSSKWTSDSQSSLERILQHAKGTGRFDDVRNIGLRLKEDRCPFTRCPQRSARPPQFSDRLQMPCFSITSRHESFNCSSLANRQILTARQRLVWSHLVVAFED